jgi:hypothetical protein
LPRVFLKLEFRHRGIAPVAILPAGVLMMHEFGSSAPMSMVISEMWPRWARRKVGRCEL